MMKLLKCGEVTYAKIVVKRFLEGKMSKMFCKLFGHKWDNALYIRLCRRCRKLEYYPENAGLKTYDELNKKSPF